MKESHPISSFLTRESKGENDNRPLTYAMYTNGKKETLLKHRQQATHVRNVHERQKENAIETQWSSVVETVSPKILSLDFSNKLPFLREYNSELLRKIREGESGRVATYSAIVKKCRLCPIRKECRRPVPPQLKDSPYWFLGRNPGIVEDTSGIPFNPTAKIGALFSKYLSVLGLNREDVSISNVCYCHTEKDRPLKQSEIEVCMRWKAVEMDILPHPPKYYFLLGNDALRVFLGFKWPSILREHGNVFQGVLRGRQAYIIPLLHPGFLLRSWREWAQSTGVFLRWIRENILSEGDR